MIPNTYLWSRLGYSLLYNSIQNRTLETGLSGSHQIRWLFGFYPWDMIMIFRTLSLNRLQFPGKQIWWIFMIKKYTIRLSSPVFDLGIRGGHCRSWQNKHPYLNIFVLRYLLRYVSTRWSHCCNALSRVHRKTIEFVGVIVLNVPEHLKEGEPNEPRKPWRLDHMDCWLFCYGPSHWASPSQTMTDWRTVLIQCWIWKFQVLISFKLLISRVCVRSGG
jgi:hypothetical protein